MKILVESLLWIRKSIMMLASTILWNLWRCILMWFIFGKVFQNYSGFTFSEYGLNYRCVPSAMKDCKRMLWKLHEVHLKYFDLLWQFYESELEGLSAVPWYNAEKEMGRLVGYRMEFRLWFENIDEVWVECIIFWWLQVLSHNQDNQFDLLEQIKKMLSEVKMLIC